MTTGIGLGKSYQQVYSLLIKVCDGNANTDFLEVQAGRILQYRGRCQPSWVKANEI